MEYPGINRSIAEFGAIGAWSFCKGYQNLIELRPENMFHIEYNDMFIHHSTI